VRSATPVIGICLFCDESKELQRSHTINKTFFSELLKSCHETNSARVISLSSDTIKNSNDNWTDRLLCKECESYFNQHFDGYGPNLLRGKIKNVNIASLKNKVIYENVDTSKLMLYFISLYWRGAKSNHPSYEALITNDVIHNFLKHCLTELKLDCKYINISVSKIYDGVGAITESSVKQMMVSPFYRLYEQSNSYSFCFIFEGFFIEIYFGKMPYILRKKREWLKPNTRVMKCDKISFYEINELHKLFSHMFIAKRNT